MSKRRNLAACTASNLPEEIMSEILLLLPARSILRFRVVCRSWAALLSSAGFTDAYAAKANARARRADRFVFFAPSPDCCSVVAYTCGRGAVAAEPLFTVDHVRADFLCLSGKPCHGAMLFSDTRSGTYWVCNPSTGECIPLPKQHRGLKESSAGLAYDDRTKQHKVVHLFKDKRYFGGCEVYTLRDPSRQWRPAKQDVQLLGAAILKLVLATEDLVTKVPPVFAKGCLHWLAYQDSLDKDPGLDAILCFSVTTETFTRLNAPASVHVAAEYRELDEDLPAVPMHLAELEGSLCLVHDLRRRGQGSSCWLDVWMLKDHASSEWSLDYRIHVAPLLTRDVQVSPRFITVLGCCSGGGITAANMQDNKKKKILVATSQHQAYTYDPDKGDVQLVLSAHQTDTWIGRKETPAALWLGLYEDSLVQIGCESHQDKEVLSAVTEILVRLPVKSITQSMLVCRQWCSLIESESFVKSHMSSPERPKKILMANNGRARHAFFHFAQVEDWLQSPALAGTLVNNMLICSKPCQGLNLISTINDDFLCNPSTGAIQCLGRLGKSHFTPPPPIHRHHRRHAFSVGRTIGFGFDKSTGDHVAVEIGYICGALACMIKTSSEKHWSCIGKPPRPVTDMPPAHVDGKLYWMSEPAHERLVLVFDISTRAFGILPCEPCSGNDNSRHAFLVELNGTLSVVVVSAGTEEMNIWMVSKHNSTWVCAYKICLDKQPDYSLKAGRVVMPVDMDGDNGRILLNTGRALGFYDTKTGALDTLYSLDQLKLPHSNFAFPVLCQESLARIQDDQLPIRVAPSVGDQGFRPCEHPEHAEATSGQGRLLLLRCEGGGGCLDVGAIYRSCCRRLFCESCHRRCVEHCQIDALRRDPMLPANNFDATMISLNTTLPFCHPSVPGPEYCYYYTAVDGDVVLHVFMCLRDYIQGKQSCRWAECGYRREGRVVKETWVRRYLTL
jgi:F-box interacting protein